MLEIVRREAGVLGDTRQHTRSDLFIIVKAEDVVGPARPTQCAMGAGAPLKSPANPKQGGIDASGFGRTPCAHAA
jgi:hypothetical protein